MKKIFSIIFIFLFLGSTGAAVYFYLNYQQIKTNPNISSDLENKNITDNVKKLIDLPLNETPSVATVTDREKLKSQDFFKKSENGDKILIFNESKKAVLYRPSVNKIIEYASLIDSAPSSSPSPSPATITIFNGTKITGLTSELEKQISDLDNISIQDKTFASKNDYSENLVLDLSGSHGSEANKIAQKIKGTLITSLPDGEVAPSTDILVIAGAKL